MQNRYVGDIGDFGKYGLLRALTGFQAASDSEPRLPLGVVWYLNPNEDDNSDGQFISFLRQTAANDKRFRECDPPLYDILRRVVEAGHRDLTSIENGDVFPGGTVYYSHSLSYADKEPRVDREARRRTWIQEALAITAIAQIVFVDPDNGLSKTANRFGKKGPKSVFMDDLIPYVHRGQSVVIYHHLGRQGTAEQQIESWSAELGEQLGRVPWSLRFHRGSARVFFVIPSDEHEAVLDARIRDFCHGPWNQHFCLVESA